MSKMPKEIKKIMAKVNSGVKAKNPAKNPALNPAKIDGVNVRMMADEATLDGAHGKEFLVRGNN